MGVITRALERFDALAEQQVRYTEPNTSSVQQQLDMKKEANKVSNIRQKC
jgi:hypothetical protein